MKKDISKTVIKRLPRYYRYLTELLDSDIECISSSELASIMKVTASQIRQDLNNFGSFGQQGSGYYVESLRDDIGQILGLNKPHKLIVIGGGNLGRAISGYSGFEKRSFTVEAIFDKDINLIGKTVRGKKILSIDTLEDYLKTNMVDIAVITLPKMVARDMAQRLYDAGIRGFWNFSHIDLSLPADAVVENVHLSDSLASLSYELKAKKSIKTKAEEK